MNNTEQTLSIIKPDAVERNLDGEIKEMFKNKGFKIVNEKKIKIEIVFFNAMLLLLIKHDF